MTVLRVDALEPTGRIPFDASYKSLIGRHAQDIGARSPQLHLLAKTFPFQRDPSAWSGAIQRRWSSNGYVKRRGHFLGTFWAHPM